MKIAAVIQVILDVPDAPSATRAAEERLASLGISGRVVRAWRTDVHFIRLSGMKKGCTATIVEASADDDTLSYKYDDGGSTYRVPRSWFARAFQPLKS